MADHTLKIELEYGDVMFTGNGPDGEGTAMIGCERKRLSDLVNSMKDRRLSGLQLRGMWTTYDFVFLFIEDLWRPGPAGEIETFTRGRDGKWGWYPFYSRDHERSAISYRQVISYLTTLELIGKVTVRRSGYIGETARQIAALWCWFNEKGWGEHKSHDQIYTNTPAKGHGSQWAREHTHDENYGRQRARLFDVKGDPTTLWRMATQLPGIDARARVVTQHFGTVREMANAEEEAWMQIDGIGKKTAAAVVKAMSEEGA